MRTRRALVTSPIRSLLSGLGWRDERAGPGPRYSPKDLESLSDERFGRIIPELSRDHRFSVSTDHFLALHQRRGDMLELAPPDEVELDMLLRFQGQETLGQLAASTAERFGLDQLEALRRARALFTRLAQPMLCRPRNRDLEAIFGDLPRTGEERGVHG